MVTAPERLRSVALPRRQAIPLSDAATMQRVLRRTTIVRVTLGTLAILLTALAVWRATTLNPRPLPFIAENASTVVVLDQSKSVYIGAYRRISALFHGLIDANAPVGLVAFSDTAYEMMPPGTPGSELAPMLRFYAPSRSGGTNVDPSTLFPETPWDDVFSGGTAISTGLILAQWIVHRDHVRHATIVLVSDLETAAEDEPREAQALLRLTHDPTITLRILPLFPVPQELAFFRRFVPTSDFIQPSQLHPRAAGPGPVQRRLVGLSPWTFVVAGGLLLVALAVNEVMCGRIVLPRVREVKT